MACSIPSESNEKSMHITDAVLPNSIHKSLQILRLIINACHNSILVRDLLFDWSRVHQNILTWENM